MGRLRLIYVESQCIDSIKGIPYNKVKTSFVRRLTFSCGVLISLALLYLPTYHYAQRSFIGTGEIETLTEGPRVAMRLVSPIAELEGWRSNTSRDLSNYILPQNVTTIVSPTEICSRAPFLLIIICSAVANFDARTAIRSTWGNKYNLDVLYDSNVKIVFLAGQSDNDTVNTMITEESEQHGDIIQERFHDTYNNLTLKSCMMLKWVTTNCPGVKFLMKSDDDMFVNIPMFMKTLKELAHTNLLIGSLICNARPISDPKNKWYTPKYMYSERTYPNYLSGTSYAMSFDVAEKLYPVALSTPLLHLEDVFVTGVCARAAKVRPINHPGFSYVQRKLETCTLRNIITAHKIDAPNMHNVWNKVQNSNVTCSNTAPTKEIKSNNKSLGYFVVRRNRKVISRCM